MTEIQRIDYSKPPPGYTSSEDPKEQMIPSWSDEHVAAAERWLVDSTMELPEVLGGSTPGDPNADDPPGTYSPIDGPHACTGCIGDGPCDALDAERDELAEIESEFMDDKICSPMPQSEQPSDAEGPLSRSRWAMSLSWDDLLRQHRDRSSIVAKAVELAALRDAYNVICEALETDAAIEAEIRRRLACDEVPTELETRIAQWRAEWVDDVEAWIEKPSSTVPEALR